MNTASPLSLMRWPDASWPSAMCPVRLCAVLVCAGLLCLGLSGCAEQAALPVSAGTGLSPELPPPRQTIVPTVNIAPARPWQPGEAPEPATGLKITAFAQMLDHPRWLLVLPNGDVLVAESNAPPKPDDRQGIRGWIMGKVMKRAGAATPSANRLTLLRDTDGDGVADLRSVLVQGLNSPFGMALIGDRLYIAETDQVVAVPYRDGVTSIIDQPVRLVELPAGTINHHWTKSLLASADGLHLYVGVGSNSNVGERGMAAETGRAAIWEVTIATGAHRELATGLRNPVGLALEPRTGALWATVNERDELGSDLVPDFLTSVVDGAFYGWPYSYFGMHVDARPSPARPDRVAAARVPDYALGPHTASLGLASAAGNQLPARFAEGMFIGQHGSWNRRPHSGYKVIFVPFQQGRPTGEAPIDVLNGFLAEDGTARGRPVGVAIDRRGGLLVADDVGNTVWRVSGVEPVLLPRAAAVR